MAERAPTYENPASVRFDANVAGNAAFRSMPVPVLTTFDAPPGYSIVRVIGPCWGITVRSRSLIGTACAGCQQNLRRGESARSPSLPRSRATSPCSAWNSTPKRWAANAVLAMRFDSGELMQNTNEIVAYGTAVTHRAGAPGQPALSECCTRRCPSAPCVRSIRLAWSAHAFHRFAHHPLCERYASELIPLGRARPAVSRLRMHGARFGRGACSPR